MSTKIPVTFDLFVDDESIIADAEKAAAYSVEKHIHRFIVDGYGKYLKQRTFEKEVDEMFKSEAFMKMVAAETARRIVSTKRFMDVIAKDVNVPETAPLNSEDVNDDTAIEYLPFSLRTINALRRGGINKVGDFDGVTILDLMKIRNLGQKSLEEIIEVSRKIGKLIPIHEKEETDDQ